MEKFQHQHKENIPGDYCEKLLKRYRHQHQERIAEMAPSTFAKVFPLDQREKEEREQPPPPAPGLSVPQYHDMSTPPPLPKF